MQVADHFLAEQLGPRAAADEPADEVQDTALEPVDMPTEQLAGFAGEYFSPELDATYRFSMLADVLVVRVEQEPPVAVTPVGNDVCEIRFRDQGMSGPARASLRFERDDDGSITGFSLSSGSEAGLVFMAR